jgi:hypothetical protein
VKKRLNMLKTSKRKIVVDIGQEELRNTTVPSPSPLSP